jgi:hypothetical protein
MNPLSRRIAPKFFSRNFAGGLLVLLAFAACAKGESAVPIVGGDSEGTDDEGDNNPPPTQPTQVISDSGAFAVGDRPRDGGTKSDATIVIDGDGSDITDIDAGADASATNADANGDDESDSAAPVDANTPPAKDAGHDSGTVAAMCSGSIAAGDLAIVELMISSESGTDQGEWVEVLNMRTCTLNIGGITISSPRGSIAPNSVTVPSGALLAPGATFVVADSSSSTANHNLPGMLFSWNASNVLENDSDTVTITSSSNVIIDSITYPEGTSSTAVSVSFPSDCPALDRSTWERWSFSFNVWTPGFEGTPNAPNDDVSCF